MGIHEDDIARVRDTSDIVAVVSEYVQLRRVGRSWQGLCPFHSERTPSFSVNADLGLYHCFGCKAGGDIITFLRETEQLDFSEAVERLAARAGITLRYTSPNEGENRKRRGKLLEAMRQAVDWYHQRLLTGPDAGPARAYLRERGLDSDTVREFRLGWAPGEWDALAQALQLPTDVFSQAGLGFTNRGGRLQDSFRSRVLFPIFTPGGDPVAFGGRVLPGEEGPKYKNSVDGPLYNKSRVLYGLNWAKQHIVSAGEVILCEGYTDVIGFARAGIPRAVATCGTALTEDHVKTLRRYAPRMVLAFDADAAGQNAAERLTQWEHAFKLELKVADMPEGSDPADLAQNDPARLKAAVERAEDFTDFRIQRVLDAGDLSTIMGRSRAGEQAAAIVAELRDPAVRDQYLMKVAAQCNLDHNHLREYVVQQQRSRAQSNNRPPTAPHPAEMEEADPEPLSEFDAVEHRDQVELQVLRLALHNPAAVWEGITAELFADPLYRAAFESLQTYTDMESVLNESPAAVADLLRELWFSDNREEHPDVVLARLVEEAAVRQRDQMERLASVERTDAEFLRQVTHLCRAINDLVDSGRAVGPAQELLALLVPQDTPLQTATGEG